MTKRGQSSTRLSGGILSIQAMAWAIEQQEIKEPSTRHVLLCLCNCANIFGDSIFPSLERLSRDTGLSVRAVRYQMRKLEKAGVLIKSDPALVAREIKRADRRPICYRVSMITAGNPLPPANQREAISRKTGGNLRPNDRQPVAADPKRSVREPKSADGDFREEFKKRFGCYPKDVANKRRQHEPE